jgi:hypothetical protein
MAANRVIDASQAHSGAHAADLCGYPGCSDRLDQTVTLPSTMTSGSLGFWVDLKTRLNPDSCSDTVNAQLQTMDGTPIAGSVVRCSAGAIDRWTHETIDLGPILGAYAGQQVQVVFPGGTDLLASLSTTFR